MHDFQGSSGCLKGTADSVKSGVRTQSEARRQLQSARSLQGARPSCLPALVAPRNHRPGEARDLSVTWGLLNFKHWQPSERSGPKEANLHTGHVLSRVCLLQGVRGRRALPPSPCFPATEYHCYDSGTPRGHSSAKYLFTREPGRSLHLPLGEKVKSLSRSAAKRPELSSAGPGELSSAGPESEPEKPR